MPTFLIIITNSTTTKHRLALHLSVLLLFMSNAQCFAYSNMLMNFFYPTSNINSIAANGSWPSDEFLLSQLRKIVRIEVRVLIYSKISQLSIMHDCVQFIYKSFSLIKYEWGRNISRL